MNSIQFFKHVFNKQPKQIVTLVFAITVGSFLEGLGVTMLVPLLNVILNKGVTDDRVSHWIHLALDRVNLPFSLESVLILFMIIILVQSGVLLMKAWITQRSRVAFERNLAISLYSDFSSASWEFFLKNKIGTLSNVLTKEVERAGNAYFMLINVLSTVMILLVYSLIVLFLSWKVTIMVVGTSLMGMMFFKGIFKKVHVYGTEITDVNNKIQASIIETLSSAKLIKAYNAETIMVNRFKKKILHLEGLKFESLFNGDLLRILYDPVVIFLLCISLYIGTSYLFIPMSELLVIFLIFYRMAPRFSNVQCFIYDLKANLPSMTLIKSIADEALSHLSKNGTTLFNNLKNDIVFNNVSFRYGKEEKDILQNISMVFKKRKLTALVGGSGSGKTTVVDLIVGLIKPWKGEILCDGIDLNFLEKSSFVEKMSYVSQDPVLFNDTVRANIEWPASKNSDEQVKEAASMAKADEFIMKLPNGYDTVLGDRGVRLSGGERQRITLARALLKDPEILILDEATSALDAESEKAIQTAIENISRKKTIIVIAHRLATVRKADMIYVLEKGEIIEKGDWDELIKKKGMLGNWVEMQKV